MKKAFKLGSLLLATALVTTGLAGCGSSTGGYDPENFLLHGTEDNPYRIVKEPVTVKIFAPHSGGQPEYKDLKMFKHLSKVTGLNFQFTTPDTSAYTNQRAAVWNSPTEIPDLFLFNNPISEIVQYAELGYNAFAPFNSNTYVDAAGTEVGNIIDNYMPTYKALLENNFGIDRKMEDAAKIATLNDGTMYSTVSAKDVARDTTYKFFINQKWIDNINNNYGGYNGKTLKNASELKTIEEYLEVLRAFKELDANDNGDPNDEIPVTSLSMEYLKNTILAAYGYVSDATEIKADGSAYVYVPYEEAYRKYLQFANTLWKEGLLHNQTFSLGAEGQFFQYGSKDRLGSMVTSAPYIACGYDLDQNYECFGPLTSDFYKGPAIHRGFGIFRPDGATIPTNSKYTREIARLIDIMYSDLGVQLISYGVENEDWTWDDEAHTSWTFHVPEDWKGNQEQYRATISPNVGSGSALYWQKDFVEKMNDEVLISINAQSQRYQAHLKVAEPLEIKLSSEEYTKVTTIKAALDPQLQFLEASFVRGDKGYDPFNDADYAKFQNQLKGYHADDLLKCFNDALARYNAKKANI